MKNSKHYICTVKDSINKFNLIGSIYCDVNTLNQAVKHFKKDKFIKKYLKNDRYHIEVKMNTFLLQDSFDYLTNWKKQK